MKARRQISFVGLTGGIASGKSLASAEFASLGVAIVDADDVGHELLSSNRRVAQMIEREFGKDHVAADGGVDRAVLRGTVFSDDGVRKRVEALLHPLIEKECRRQMMASEGIYGMLVAPLMFETRFMLDMLKRVLLIDIGTSMQLKRGIERGKFTEQQLQAAIAAQMTQQQRRDHADDIIVNDGSAEQLREAVRQQHETYAELFHSR